MQIGKLLTQIFERSKTGENREFDEIVNVYQTT